MLSHELTGNGSAAANEVFQDMEDFVRGQLRFLKPVQDSWQPQDLLPDMTAEDWREKIESLRTRASGLSDEVLVVLIGNLVTEEALPAYQTWLNRIEEIRDRTGADDTPWAQWTRGWTAEENRHGDVLNKYLYLTGRVDMKMVEITTHHLLRNGFDLKSGTDPYQSLVYASFQERATKISHANTGKVAEKCGDTWLAHICATIAGDEARHEEAYKKFFAEVIRRDPGKAVTAFALMMRQKVSMPARLMSDGTDRDLFTQFAVVAQKSGVYTTLDYADVIEHLVDYWKIAALSGLDAEAAKSQEYLCGLGARYRDKADRVQEIIQGLPQEPFLWLYDRKV